MFVKSIRHRINLFIMNKILLELENELNNLLKVNKELKKVNKELTEFLNSNNMGIEDPIN